MKHDIIDFLSNKSILILGYGREGKSALEFIRTNLPGAKVAVADANPLDLQNVKTITGPNYLDAMDDYDLIIKSPGVPALEDAFVRNAAKITSLTDMFMRFCQNPIIGVTGTKGKSTTASLTHHILKQCGRDTILVGNIGIACFTAIDQIKPETIIVFELSCHQLEFIQASPHVAILLNLYQEHFDHYRTPEDYYNAKKNIYKFQGSDDVLIYGDIFHHANHEEIEHLPMHKVDIYHDINIPSYKISTNLVGDHNLHDIYAAIAACEAMGLSEDEILPTIASFHGLPHRMEYVGKFHGVDYYNDSIATAQEAVINAVKALKRVDTLILGGMERNLDYHPLVEFLRTSSVRNIILLPNTAESFQRIFNEAPFSQQLILVRDMAEAVARADQFTAKEHICLLSPAAASYGFYKNFEERGDDFKRLVGMLK